MYAYFLSREVLMRPLGNIIYLIPPYCITDEELELAYGAIEGFLGTLAL
jgi:adenosylmethionine-8-amino-7-oxononanoate aminotransferase